MYDENKVIELFPVKRMGKPQEIANGIVWPFSDESFDMVRENKKTVLRTIRLSKGLDELLQKDAHSKRITVGALVSTILTKYN